MRDKNKLIETLDILNSLPPMGTEDYTQHVQELIDNLKSVKSTLKSGPDRKNFRKESANLQRAIEALRYLNRRNQRMLKTETINNHDHLVLLNEFTAANIGTTDQAPRCNLGKSLQRAFNISRKTAANITDIFGGFVPYYLCDAAEGASEQFAGMLINPLKSFRNALAAFTSGTSEQEYLLRLNANFTTASLTEQVIKDKYKNTNYSSGYFNAIGFINGIVQSQEAQRDAAYQGTLTDISKEVNANAADAAESAATQGETRTAKGAYFQTFARGVCNHLIKKINEESNFDIEPIDN